MIGQGASEKKQAFTLIELIVVVVIVGILAAIALPSYTGTREKAFDRQAIVALRLLRAANQQYFSTQELYYPPSGTVSSLTTINDALKTAVNSTNWAIGIRGNGTFSLSAHQSRVLRVTV